VNPDDITTIYTPLDYSDWRETVDKIKAFGSQEKRTAVISSVTGDANGHLYKELAAQQIEARKIPVMTLSASARELRNADMSGLVGHMAARSYFQSITTPENDAFVKMWGDSNEQRDTTTDAPMEATFIGFRMWTQAVAQANTTDVNAVRQAMYGQRIKSPSGYEVVMNTNHHLSKPALIGKLNPAGTFDVVWRSINPIKASVWSRYLPESARLTADWTFPWFCGGCAEPTYKE
jgi:urea transport system substrate-binding protein